MEHLQSMGNLATYCTENKVFSAASTINKLQLGIEIMEGVQYFERQINHSKQSLAGFPGTFPELRVKYMHSIEIYQMCIERLISRYKKLMK